MAHNPYFVKGRTAAQIEKMTQAPRINIRAPDRIPLLLFLVKFFIYPWYLSKTCVKCNLQINRPAPRMLSNSEENSVFTTWIRVTETVNTKWNCKIIVGTGSKLSPFWESRKNDVHIFIQIYFYARGYATWDVFIEATVFETIVELQHKSTFQLITSVKNIWLRGQGQCQ